MQHGDKSARVEESNRPYSVCPSLVHMGVIPCELRGQAARPLESLRNPDAGKSEINHLLGVSTGVDERSGTCPEGQVQAGDCPASMRPFITGARRVAAAGRIWRPLVPRGRPEW